MTKTLIIYFILIANMFAGSVFYSNDIFNPNSFFLYKDKMCVVDLGTGVSCLSQDNTKIEKMNIDESFRLPAAAISSGDLIYICDYRNNRMVIFDANKNSVIKIFSHNLMSDPEGVAIDNQKNIYVASYGNGKILKFDSSGNFISVFVDDLVHPHGIFFYDNKIYVTELYLDKRVIVYDMLGTKLSEFGNKGDDRLRYPTSIWVDNEGIYVSDATASSIKIYDSNNYRLKNIVGGISGSSEKSYYYPYGVAKDKNFLYIADTHNRAIKILDKNTLISNSIIVDELLKQNFSQDKNELNQYKIEYKKITPNLVKKQVISIAKDRSSFEFCLDISNCKTYSGYDYIWSVRILDGKYLVVIDEPGALQIIDIKDFSTINYSLTSFQFDPLESIAGFIYRFQDIEYYNGYFYIANTLPGNIVKLNPFTSSVEELIGVSDVIFKPLKIKQYKENLVVNDIYGFVYILNMKTNAISKINNKFDDLIDLMVVDQYLLIVDTNGVYIFDEYFNFMGHILLKEKILNVFINGKEIVFDTTTNSFAIEQLSIKKNTPLKQVSKIISTGQKPNIATSSFVKAYGGAITSKPLKYYEYYKTEEGIVKYDFGFSWLNFNIPVKPGYGAHVYFPVVSHYAMLSYYNYKINSDANSKFEFEKHVKFLLNNIDIKDNKAYLYEKIELKNTKDPFLSASTQISSAAVIYKYYLETKNEEYLELCKKLLRVLDELKYDYDKYSLFINFPQQDRHVPHIQDLLWNIIFLDELDSLGNDYKNTLLKTLFDFRTDKKIKFFSSPVMTVTFEGNPISIYNTKIYNRVFGGFISKEDVLMDSLIRVVDKVNSELVLEARYSTDPIDILNAKKGSCAQFAYLATYILRQKGYQARNISIFDTPFEGYGHAMTLLQDNHMLYLLDPTEGLIYKIYTKFENIDITIKNLDKLKWKTIEIIYYRDKNNLSKKTSGYGFWGTESKVYFIEPLVDNVLIFNVQDNSLKSFLSQFLGKNSEFEIRHKIEKKSQLKGYKLNNLVSVNIDYFISDKLVNSEEFVNTADVFFDNSFDYEYLIIKSGNYVKINDIF